MILAIEYPNGARRAILPPSTRGKVRRSRADYRIQDANGKTYGVSGYRARSYVKEFIEICAEGRARIIRIDAAAVSQIDQCYR